MFRKRIAALAWIASLVLLAGCTQQTADEAKILKQEVKVPSSNLKVTLAYRGRLSRETTASAELLLTKKTVVRLEVDGAQYGERMVTEGQLVSAGDPIATFYKEADTVRMTAIGLEMKEIENERKDGLARFAERKEDLEEQLADYGADGFGYNTVSRENQQKMIQLELDKLELEKAQFELQLDERSRKLTEERQKLKEAEKELTVTAPVDGIVSSIQYMSTGTPCSRGMTVAVVYDPAQVLLEIKTGSKEDFRMGQKVTVTYGGRNSQKTTTGRVVAADNVLKAEDKDGSAYVALDEPIEAEKLTNLRVTTRHIYVDNVLLLPRDAVQHDNAKPYVEVAMGSSTSVRYILTGPGDGTSVPVLVGLEEDTAVINK